MAVPAWFDAKVYRDNKIADLNANGSHYDALTFTSAFEKAGFTNDAEGLYSHFQSYGNSENVSPNSYFDANYYYQAKAADYFLGDSNLAGQVTDSQVQYIKSAFAKFGLSAWDHYNTYGWLEGLDPNANFSTNKYLAAKLEMLQKDDPSYTLEDVINAFKGNGLNPVTHYYNYGDAEGIKPSSGSHANPVQNLTTGTDNLSGTLGDPQFDESTGNITPVDHDFDDNFKGEVGTLQSADIVDGLGGDDTLYAIVDADRDVKAGSLNPTITNVEYVFFQSQIGNGQVREPAAPVSAVVDADRITLDDTKANMTIGSVNSRAHLKIEDVSHNSNVTTVRFADADPTIDLRVYFDPQNLKATEASTTNSLIIQLMDVQSCDDTGGVSPLVTSPYNGFIISYDGGDAVSFVFREEDQSLYKTSSANYNTLLTAVQHAIEDAGYSGKIEATLGARFTSKSIVDDKPYEGSGYNILLTAKNATLERIGFTTENGTSPWSNRYVAEMIPEEPDEECPLIKVNVEVTNVGRVQWHDASDCLPDDIIKGSNAGDLEIGSMSMRSGVERMDVKVDEGSWLEGLYSTNNTLRMVTVEGKDINGDGIIGTIASHYNQNASNTLVDDGALYIGAWDGKLDDEGNGNSNLTWTDPAKLLTASGYTTGLKDVAVFDASAYKGVINIGAQITEESYDKYLKSVDGTTLINKWAPISGYDGAFTYLTGSADDVVNMTVAGDIAADVDFKQKIVTNDGDDLVAFRYDDMSGDQAVNQKYLKNVTIDTGNGDDHVWFYGAKDSYGTIVHDEGSVVVNAGSGRDVIYANQVEFFTGGADEFDSAGVTLGADDYNTVYLFNASTAHEYSSNAPVLVNEDSARQVGINGFDGATLNNDILTGTANTGSYNLQSGYDSLYVVVNFRGVVNSAKVTDVTYSSSHTTETFSYDDIHSAMITAINDESSQLSSLLYAKDGAGHSLLVESLINGEMDLGDLTVTLQYRDSTKVKANFDLDHYGKEFAVDKYYDSTDPLPHLYAGVSGSVTPTGFESLVESQAVVNAGAGNDLIVLGENHFNSDDDWAAGTARYSAETYLGSTDVVVLSGSFGNDRVFDFEAGVDKINVKGLGLNSVSAVLNAADDLSANVATIVAKAVSGTNHIFTQSEINDYQDANTPLIAFDSSAKAGDKAVVLVQDDRAFTFVLAEKASSSGTEANATVMGSLTFDDDTNVDVNAMICSLVGVSTLVSSGDVA